MKLSFIIKTLFITFFLFVGATSVHAQEELLSKMEYPFVPSKVIDSTVWDHPNPTNSCINSLFYDSLTNILYIGGWLTNVDIESRSGIAAIDINTGKLLPWNPKVIGGQGGIYSICKKGDTVFIGGDFKKVNGISCPYLAAISSSTGNLLKWRPSPDSIIKSLYIDADKLYVGGRFHQISSTNQSYLSIFNLNNLALSSWQPKIPDTLGGCTNLSIYKNKLYYNPQRNTVNGIWWNERVESIDLGSFSINNSYLDPLWVTSNYNIVNDILFCTGWANINGQTRKGFAIDINSKNMLSWNPPLDFSIPTVAGIYYIFKPFEKSFYAGVQFSPLHRNQSTLKRYSMQGKGDVESVLKLYSILNDTIPQSSNVLFDQFTIGNDKLILLDRIYHYNKYAGDSIHVYCLPIPAPTNFTTAQTKVCANQQVIYSVPSSKRYSTYNWSYSGTGVTINGNGSTATVSFSTTATSGILSVSGSNECGKTSPALTLNIAVEQSPKLLLASSGIITCTQPQTQLTASSPASVSYSWTGPNNFNSTQANVQVIQQGLYKLKITDQNSGCNTTDSVLVKADTAKPKPSITASTYTLTCIQPKLTLTGSTLSSGDSLQWLTATGAILANPLTVSTPGQYIFIATSRTNGCPTRLPLTIGSNTVHPQLSLPTAIDTLTCKKTSVVVSFSSSTPNANLYWQSATGTIYNNPATLTESGNYTILVSDPINGCISKATVTIPEDKVLPLLTLPTHQLALNCSNPYSFIKAISNHDSIVINWKNEADSLFVNPLFITTPGTYRVTANNPYNGCSTNDQVIATFKNELLVSAGSNVNLCPDNGSVSLQATVTDPYHYAGALTYNWEPAAGTDATATVKPKTTTTYQLSVKSSKGCEGKGQVTVTVLPAMQDSLSITHPCFTNDGKVNIKIKNNNYPPYTYWATDTSSNLIKPVQDSATFVNLKGFTSYYFFIKDRLGCIKQTSKVQLGALAKAPVIDFLVSSYLMSKDTFVLVNISEPLPDKVVWEIDKATILYSDNHKAIAVRTDTGIVAAGLQASYGRCESTTHKTIRITPYDSTQVKEDKLKGIRLLNLSPNPNSGKFTINLKLGVKQNFTLVVYDALGIIYYNERIQNSDSYQKEVDLNLLPGTYILKVIATYDVRQKAFLVIEQ